MADKEVAVLAGGHVRSILFAAIIAGTAVSARATDLYVSTNGADSNSGTNANTPLRSIAAATARAQPGDTVWLLPGTYQESIVPVRSGTANAPITYKSYGPGHAVLTHVPVGIFIQSVNYIVVDSIDVDGGAAPPKASVSSFVTLANSSHSVIRNGSFHNANGWGGINVSAMYADAGSPITAAPKHEGQSSFDTIEDNVVDNVGDFTQAQGDAIQIRFGDIDHILVQKNTVKHGGHDLLRLDCEYCVVQDNTFDNDYRDLFGGSAGYRSVSMNGTFNVFQRNLVEHSGLSGLKVPAPLMTVRGVKNIARNNVLYDGINLGFESGCGYSPSFVLTDARIYNNTLYKLGGTSWAVWAFTGCTSTGRHVFANNLSIETRLTPGIIPGGDPSVTSIDADAAFMVSGGSSSLVNMNAGPTANSVLRGNIFQPRPGAQLQIDLQNNGGLVALSKFASANPKLAAGNFAASPQLVSAAPVAMADFRLKATSAGVGQGVFLTNTTAAGNSAVIPVADSLYFTDGNSLIEGDTVQLQGSTQRARILSIDRNANTLKLSAPLSFTRGQGVSLTYNGTAPDVGADPAMNAKIPLAPAKISVRP